MSAAPVLIAVLVGPAVGVIFGYLLWCILKIGSLFVSASRSMDMLAGASGSQRKFERRMKEYSPDFSFTYFTGKVIFMLRILLYAKDVQAIPFYMGEP